jgi:hypothetical protein
MSKSGGNHKKNGDPNYTVVISVKHDPDKDGPMMDIWQKAPPAILAKIKELAGGGGGFTSAGAPHPPPIHPPARTRIGPLHAHASVDGGVCLRATHLTRKRCHTHKDVPCPAGYCPPGY